MRTYTNYLKINELLRLQQAVSDPQEHDETLFIIIHQVYELWFKELLHELDYLQSLMAKGDSARCQHTLGRILRIFKVMVGQIDVLETMTPLEFLSFRNRLEAASGFQSVQFRELEFALGHRQHSLDALSMDHDASAMARLRKRQQNPSLWDSFVHFLHQSGYPVPDAVLKRDVTQPIVPSKGLQALLIEIYRTNATLAELCERLVDLDEALSEWRYKHIRMVQRTIGTKRGTGGSSGVAYLKTTLLHTLYEDLWAIRSKL